MIDPFDWATLKKMKEDSIVLGAKELLSAITEAEQLAKKYNAAVHEFRESEKNVVRLGADLDTSLRDIQFKRSLLMASATEMREKTHAKS